MKTLDKNWTSQKLNLYKTLCKIGKIVRVLERFNWVLAAMAVFVCMYLSYQMSPSDLREVISFIFVPIISAAAALLVVNYINRVARK